MKGEVENFKGEVRKIETPKPVEVTMEDMNIMKRMIFEIKDFVSQTDNFVRQNLLTKLELNNTSVEDISQQMKTTANRYLAFNTS